MRRLTFDTFAILKTGAAMSATTAGRMPMKMLSTTRLSRNSRKNTARMRMNSTGITMLPATAVTAPRVPRNRLPTSVATLAAKMPGNACATDSTSRKSSLLSHPRRSTNSFSISGIMA